MKAFRVASSRPVHVDVSRLEGLVAQGLEAPLPQLQAERRAGPDDRLGIALVEGDDALGEEFAVEEGEERPQVLVLALEELADPGSPEFLVEVVQGLRRGQGLAPAPRRARG